MLFIAKYMMLLVAICTNVVLAMDNNLDQDLKVSLMINMSKL